MQCGIPTVLAAVAMSGSKDRFAVCVCSGILSCLGLDVFVRKAFDADICA